MRRFDRKRTGRKTSWHGDHWATSHDLISRMMMSYADMAPHSDYLKIVVYQAVFPGLLRAWSNLAQQSVLSDFTPERALRLHNDARLRPRSRTRTTLPSIMSSARRCAA